MSYNAETYTVRLYQILIEYLADKEKLSVDEIIYKYKSYEITKLARECIFDFEYELFSEDYKETLETNFLNHFYTRQIGSETFNLFKQRFYTDFIIKIPTYNQLYKSVFDNKDINPLIVDEVNEKYSRTIDSNNESITKATGSNTASTEQESKYSDTPAGLVSGKNYLTNMTVGNNANKVESENDGTSESVSKNVEDYEHSRSGRSSIDYATLIMNYRNSLINVDMILFEDLDDNFISLFN